LNRSKTSFGHAQAHAAHLPCSSGPAATFGVHQLLVPREVIVLAVGWYLQLLGEALPEAWHRIERYTIAVATTNSPPISTKATCRGGLR